MRYLEILPAGKRIIQESWLDREDSTKHAKKRYDTTNPDNKTNYRNSSPLTALRKWGGLLLPSQSPTTKAGKLFSNSAHHCP